MKIKSKSKYYDTLFLRHYKRHKYLEIKLTRKITSENFFNINFNLHHLNIDLYTTYGFTFPNDGWIILDNRIESDDVMDDILEIDFNILNDIVKNIKKNCKQTMRNYQVNECRLPIFDSTLAFVKHISHDDALCRTSISQINRSYNQKKLLALDRLNIYPNTKLLVSDVYNRFLDNLKRYSLLWFGGPELNEQLGEKELCQSESENRFIKDFSELQEILTTYETTNADRLL